MASTFGLSTHFALSFSLAPDALCDNGLMDAQPAFPAPLVAQLGGYAVDELIESKHERYSWRLLLELGMYTEIDLGGRRVLVPGRTPRQITILRTLTDGELLITFVHDATVPPGSDRLIVALYVAEAKVYVATVMHELYPGALAQPA